MSVFLLGNIAPHEVAGVDDDGKAVHRTFEVPNGKVITTMILPDSDTASEKMRNITHDDGHWRKHSSENPAWVESDDAELAQAVAYFYGCPVGRPADWDAEVSE